jgi:hypothetical protein
MRLPHRELELSRVAAERDRDALEAEQEAGHRRAAAHVGVPGRERGRQIVGDEARTAPAGAVRGISCGT